MHDLAKAAAWIYVVRYRKGAFMSFLTLTDKIDICIGVVTAPPYSEHAESYIKAWDRLIVEEIDYNHPEFNASEWMSYVKYGVGKYA